MCILSSVYNHMQEDFVHSSVMKEFTEFFLFSSIARVSHRPLPYWSPWSWCRGHNADLPKLFSGHEETLFHQTDLSGH